MARGSFLRLPATDVAGYCQRSLRDLFVRRALPGSCRRRFPVAFPPEKETAAHSTLDRSIIASLSGDLCAFFY